MDTIDYARFRGSAQPLLAVFGQANLRFRRYKNEYICTDHDSLTVYQDRKTGAWKYKWFAQGDQGDVFDAARAYCSVEHDRDVLRLLGETPVTATPTPALPTKTPVEPLWLTAQKAVERLDITTRHYLRQERHLWDEVIEQQRLGLHHWYNRRTGDQVPCVSIPIYPPGATEPTAIRLRLLADVVNDKGKPLRYMSVYGSQSTASPLVVRIHDQPRVSVIVGGEFKAFTLFQALIEHYPAQACDVQIISPPGEGIWQSHWRYLIATPLVYVIPDPDAAGAAYLKRIREHIHRAIPLLVPGHQKIDDALHAGIDVRTLFDGRI